MKPKVEKAMLISKECKKIQQMKEFPVARMT